MGYSNRTIVDSALLRGHKNGQLPPSILVATPGQADGVPVRLIAPAARAWKALCAAGLAAGHIFKATSTFDSYRPYDVQERIFKDRYTTTYLRGRPYKTWNGRRWYQKPGTAVAAVPGTSNHGKGEAVDCGEERDSDAGAESLDNPTLQWLLANEERFGFFHSVPSEPWHIDYFPGDKIPQAVLAYERNAGNTQTGDDEVAKAIWTTKGYWLCQGGTRESINDGDDMDKVRDIYGAGVCYPGADGNGFPTPQLDLPVDRGGRGWTWDEIDRLLGRERTGK